MRNIQGVTEAKRHLVSTISTLFFLFLLASLSSCVGINEGLRIAAQRGDTNKFKRLVEKGADANASYHDTALSSAAMYGNTEALKFLSEKGVDVNIRLYHNSTALMIAAKYGNTEALKFLIEKGADINATNWEGETALILAAKEGRTNAIKLLIENSADVHAKDKDGHTALYWARVSHGYWGNKINQEMAIKLLQEAMQPILAAAETGNLDKIKSLLAQGSDVNARDWNGRTVLMYAAKNSQLDAINLLIENGADVNAKDEKGYTALMIAVMDGGEEVVKHLINRGADVHARLSDYPYKTALKIAEENGYTEVANIIQETIQPSILSAAETGNLDKIKSLLAQAADVNAKDINGNTALAFAAANGHASAIDLVIKEGADVNAKNNDGMTALMHAAGNGQLEAIRVLIKEGADVNVKDKHDWTALMYAARNDHASVIELLIKEGADINANNNDGMTSLIYAAKYGHKSAIESLLNKGAHIGNALMFAAESGQAAAISVLLKNDADVNAKDINGNTALVFAAANGHAKAIRLLLENDAHVHVGEDAKRNYDRGNTAVEMAKNPADYIKAIAEYEKAKALAPAWADVYYNLALTQELAKKYGDAATSLKQYLRLAPGADNAEEIKSHINKLEYQAEKVKESQNVIKKLTAPGEWRLISGENPAVWAHAFRLRDGKLEGSITQPQPRFRVNNQEWVWRPVSFNGKILEYNFIFYQAPPELNNGAPYGVSVKAEIVSVVPLRLKNNAVWSQQFGRRSIQEYEYLLEKFDN